MLKKFMAVKETIYQVDITLAREDKKKLYEKFRCITEKNNIKNFMLVTEILSS